MAIRRILQRSSLGKYCLEDGQNKTFFREITSSLVNFKTKKDTIDAIIRWNSENLDIYGPVLKTTTKRLVNLQRADSSVKEHAKTVEPIIRNSASDIQAGEKDQSNSTIKTPKKRGRPKKIKDPVLETGPQKLTRPTDTSQKAKLLMENQKNYNITKEVPVDFEEVTDNKDQQTGPNLSGLDGILFFPMFPPEKTEFYVNPPEVPDIHIPGHSERSSFDNPYFPSVGTILGGTQPIESKIALKRWRDNLVKELGEDGFKQHRKSILDRGVDFHNSIQKFLEGTPQSEISVVEGNEGYWSSAQQVMRDVEDVHSVEEPVIHRALCYRGQYDCVMQYRNELVLVDWKTSKKTKADIRYTFDNPVQVAAYVGANNFSQNAKFMIDKALLVVCYEDGQPAHTHLLSRRMCVDYWAKWLQRLHLYWTQKLSPN